MHILAQSLHKEWSFWLKISSLNQPNRQETADLVTFTVESLMEDFLVCAVNMAIQKLLYLQKQALNGNVLTKIKHFIPIYFMLWSWYKFSYHPDISINLEVWIACKICNTRQLCCFFWFNISARKPASFLIVCMQYNRSTKWWIWTEHW